ncbi:tRNA-dependent cyclodipeptide synthase [Nocardia sp. NPDC006044]|uniref:tRNA-dependent cyclodipeptide synthase n=1 Tax=Nocardia sp. NPDC006044 TaxID=3364306 RepID=UPI003691FB1B
MAAQYTMVSGVGRSDRDRAIIDSGESIIFGLSTFNGWFTAPVIRGCIYWAVKHFEHVYALLPGPEAALRFTSAGMPARRAVGKVIKAVHEHRRVARSALMDAGYRDPDQNVLVWTRFAGNARYTELRSGFDRALTETPALRTVTRQVLAQVLANEFPHGAPDYAIDANTPYISAEAPLFIDGAAVLGHSSLTFAYPRPFPVYDLLESGAVPSLALSSHQGFALLSVQDGEGNPR